MIDGPIIKLELQEMKFSILHHLGLYQQRISEQVDEQVQYVIDSFDFATVISDEINKALKEAISEYFRFGDGKKVINMAIKEGLKSMFKQEEGDAF